MTYDATQSDKFTADGPMRLSNFLTAFFLPTAFIPARYILSILGSIAMAIIYGLKVNLSVAMVAMVNHTAVRLQHEAESNGTSHSSVNFEAREECEAENRSSSGGSQVNS